MIFSMEIYSENDGWKEHGRYNSAKDMYDAWLSIYDDSLDLDPDKYNFNLISGPFVKPITLYHWGRTFTGWAERFGRSGPIKTRRKDEPV